MIRKLVTISKVICFAKSLPLSGNTTVVFKKLQKGKYFGAGISSEISYPEEETLYSGI